MNFGLLFPTPTYDVKLPLTYRTSGATLSFSTSALTDAPLLCAHFPAARQSERQNIWMPPAQLKASGRTKRTFFEGGTECVTTASTYRQVNYFFPKLWFESLHCRSGAPSANCLERPTHLKAASLCCPLKADHQLSILELRPIRT